MAFDGIVTKAITTEITPLCGARIDKVFEPNKNEIILGLYLNGCNYALNICIEAQNCRLNLTTHSKPNPQVAPNFCMLLRKNLIGLKLKNIITFDLERLIILEFEGFDELDDIKDDLRTNPMPDFEQYAHTPTREACLALKSRVLLYAASPLFNERPIEIGNELIGYASYDREHWNDAAKAAKTFIDEYGPNGNGAYGLTQSTSDGDNRDFRDVFLGFYNKTNNPEVIFYRPGGEDKSIESNNGPLGFSGDNLGKGRTLPTQNLVDAFPMKDGMFAGQGSKYTLNQSNPYENRDPRLDYTILHHGSSWLNNTLDISIGGVNNPSNSAEYSKTGYYMCKFMGKFGEESQYGNKIHLWVMFRYAEMLLNYAEAMNEYLSSPSQDVYDAIIALRARAGIEAGNDESPYGLKKNMTQAEMREVIQNERRIEMAFEEQRYWDIRRWRIAEEIFKNPLEGLEIRVKGNTTSFNEVDVLSTTFDVKRYLYPIPYNEVVKNDNMIQNPKW